MCSFSSPCSFPVAFWLSTEVNDTMPELPLNPMVFPPLGYFSHRPAGNFNLYAFNLFETRRFLNVFPCPPSWLFSYSLNVNSYFPSSSFSLLLFLVVGNGLKSVQSGRGLNPMVSPHQPGEWCHQQVISPAWCHHQQVISTVRQFVNFAPAVAEPLYYLVCKWSANLQTYSPPCQGLTISAFCNMSSVNRQQFTLTDVNEQANGRWFQIKEWVVTSDVITWNIWKPKTHNLSMGHQ